MKTPQHLLVTLILAFFTLSAARLYGENYIYVTNNGTITITSYTGPGGAVNVPETINGLPVTAITGTNYVISPPFYVGFTNRVGAFAGNTNVTSINIPAGVVSIWPEAFDGCTNLSALAVDAVSPAYSSVGGVLFDRSKATLIKGSERGRS